MWISRRLQLLILTIFYSTATFAGTVTVTDANISSVSRQTPIIAIIGLGCDVGSYYTGMFLRRNEDLKGVQLGVIDGNGNPKIMTQIYDLYQKENFKEETGLAIGMAVLIKNGKVVHTSEMGYPGRTHISDLSGAAPERRWIMHALAKNGIPFEGTYKPLPDDWVAPESDAGAPVDLSRGRIAHYKFDDLKDSTKSQRDFIIRGGARLEKGTVFVDGKFGKTAAGFMFKNRTDVFKNSFSWSLSFNPESQDSNGWSYLCKTGDSVMEVMLRDGRLLLQLHPTYARGESGALGEWRFQYEEMVSFKKSHALVVSVDMEKNRVRVLLDGRRLRDVALDSKLSSQLREQEPGVDGMDLENRAGGFVFHGNADNMILYSRALNGAEMIALAREIGSPMPTIVEPAKPDQSVLDLRLARAARNGDPAGIKNALASGANVNSLQSGWSPLHFAAYYGHVDAAKALMDANADPLLQISGFTAQQLAHARGFAKVVILLEDYSNTTRFYHMRRFLPPSQRARANPTPPGI